MSHKSDDLVFQNYKKIWDDQIKKLNYSKFNFEFKFLYCDNEIDEDYKIIGNELISKCVEDYWYSLILKLMNGLDFFIKNDFNFVFKTNLSTIINFEKFYEYCNNIPKHRDLVYDGIVGNYEDYYFCSGAGILLNKKTVDLILSNKSLLNNSWTDDIFIGFILNKLNKIEPNVGKISRFDIVSDKQTFNKQNILNNTHIRIKVRKNNMDINFSNIVYNYLNQ
jgi:hypothetical protein